MEDVTTEKIIGLITSLVNDYYTVLQTYENQIFSIDNEVFKLSVGNNISRRIRDRIIGDGENGEISATDDSMFRLSDIVNELLDNFGPMFITSNSYAKNILGTGFFTHGSTSPNVLLELKKSNQSVILKTMPLSWYHHYIFFDSDEQADDYVQTYIEAPLCGIFLKEAWIVLFAKQILSKYTPGFDCMRGCWITKGFPAKKSHLPEIKKSYYVYKKYHPMNKKWFDILIPTDQSGTQSKSTSRSSANDISSQLFKSYYLSVEMTKNESTIRENIILVTEINRNINLLAQKSTRLMDKNLVQKLINIEKILSKGSAEQKIISKIVRRQQMLRIYEWEKRRLEDLVTSKKFSLGFVFEYLYTKIIAAFVGRIIFTDDHFDNLMFKTVDYVRHYRIKSNHFVHDFYMTNDKMTQFIDLERYVFNFSSTDTFCNSVLKKLIPSLPKTKSAQLNQNRTNYLHNEFIFDKGLCSLMDPRDFPPECFVSTDEYEIMINILTDKNISDMHSFCQIMHANLPLKYLRAEMSDDNNKIKHYEIDLDNDSLRIITKDHVK